MENFREYVNNYELQKLKTVVEHIYGDTINVVDTIGFSTDLIVNNPLQENITQFDVSKYTVSKRIEALRYLYFQ